MLYFEPDFQTSIPVCILSDDVCKISKRANGFMRRNRYVALYGVVWVSQNPFRFTVGGIDGPVFSIYVRGSVDTVYKSKDEKFIHVNLANKLM